MYSLMKPLLLLLSFFLLIAIGFSNYVSQTSSDGNFIAVYSSEALDYDDANDLCIDEFGTELATLTSDSDSEQVAAAIQLVNGGFLFGVPDPLSCGCLLAWIGARNPSSNVLVWEDGSDTDYTNFGSGEPNSNSEECIHLDSRHLSTGPNGLTIVGWNDYICSGVMNGLICNAPEDNGTNAPSEEPTAQPRVLVP